MLDKDPAVDSFCKKAWYLFLIVVYSIFYMLLGILKGSIYDTGYNVEHVRR